MGHSARERLNSYYKTPSEKNRIIVEQVSSGEPGAVDKFCEILKKNRRTNYISEKLEKGYLIMYFVFHTLKNISIDKDKTLLYSFIVSKKNLVYNFKDSSLNLLTSY